MTVLDDPILVEAADGVATLTINRPDRLNAMDSRTHLALSDALDRLADDDAVRVLVLTGAGTRAFSVGRDLREISIDDAAEQAEIAARWVRVTRLTDRFDYPKPIIAKVRGLALGGGFELALACDLIIAVEDASFGLPEVRRGLIPSAGGVHRLPRQIPLKVATGMSLTGRTIDAMRAFELGLINEAVPADRLDVAVAGWVGDILTAAPLAIRSVRQCLANGLGRPLAEAMRAVYPAELHRQTSDDASEGPRAFAEKRAPRWTGR